MEPPSSFSTAATVNGGGKLRLMCSYGGHITHRPRSKSLCYAGGDTRIVAVDRRAVATLDSFVSHLAVTLAVNFPFTLKYQLPRFDLDSLISVTSDEDFQILIDEHDRLSSSPIPSRIRLFLFPVVNSGLGRPVIRHPKTESWFFDALKGTKIGIMQKGVYGSGFENSGQESMVLETSSSFGSTSSSASLTNLPSLKTQNENNETASILPSDNSVYQETMKLESKIPHCTNLEVQQQVQQYVMYNNPAYPVYQLVPLKQMIPQNNNNSYSFVASSPFAPPANAATSSSVVHHVPNNNNNNTVSHHHHPSSILSQNVAVTSKESSDCDGGGDIDPVRIYKSQPPPPSMSSFNSKP